MIKQIKPNSLSHKFLSLIFEEYEIRHGINICDVPWRALKMLVMTVVSAVAILMFGGMLLGYVVGVVLALLSPFFQYNYFFASLAGLSLVSSAVGAATYFIISIVECSHGNIPLLPTYIKKTTPKEPSPPSVPSLWWTSFKEKTCFKIVVDNMIVVDKLETDEETSYEEEEEEEREPCVVIYKKDGEKFVEVEDCMSAGYRIKSIIDWLPYLVFDYMYQDQEIYLGETDSEDKLLISIRELCCLMWWQEENPNAEFSIAAYNIYKI